MIREMLVATTMGAAIVCGAPTAGAQPGPSYFDEPGHYSGDVPGMSYDAHLSGPCTNMERNTFGRGPSGEPLQCRWIPNQWPPVSTGFWQATYQLYGVRDIGSACPDPQSAAQAPDGRPLLCLGPTGWQPGFFTDADGGFSPR
jgi:hypothetical protein